MRFVAILKSDDSVIRVDATHSVGRTRRESGRAGYDAFLHHFKNKQGTIADLGVIGANLFRDAIENCIDECGEHNGQSIRRSISGRGFLPNSVLKAKNSKSEATAQLYVMLELDGNHEETDQIMRQVMTA